MYELFYADMERRHFINVSTDFWQTKFCVHLVHIPTVLEAGMCIWSDGARKERTVVCMHDSVKGLVGPTIDNCFFWNGGDYAGTSSRFLRQ